VLIAEVIMDRGMNNSNVSVKILILGNRESMKDFSTAIQDSSWELINLRV
jgi:hypothetical protein